MNINEQSRLADVEAEVTAAYRALDAAETEMGTSRALHDAAVKRFSHALDRVGAASDAWVEANRWRPRVAVSTRVVVNAPELRDALRDLPQFEQAVVAVAQANAKRLRGAW